WMQLPELAKARQPAVEVADFPLWQELQSKEAIAGHAGFNVLQWQQRRPQLVTEKAAGPQPEVTLIPASQGLAAPHVGKLSATLGPGSGANQLREPHGIASDHDGNVYV